ncbi:MAG: hypothetical protein ACLFST_03605 [Spirochaetia bacterium]
MAAFGIGLRLSFSCFPGAHITYAREIPLDLSVGDPVLAETRDFILGPAKGNKASREAQATPELACRAMKNAAGETI